MPQPCAPLPRAASAYHLAVLAAAAAAVGTVLAVSGPGESDWTLLALAVAGAAVSNLPVADERRHFSLRTTSAFFVLAAIVLRPGLVLAVAGAAWALPFLRHRRKLSKELFNLASFLLIALSAWGAFHAAGGSGAHGLRFAAAGAAAAAVLVAVNHGLLATMIALAERTPLQSSQLFRPSTVAAALWVAGTGVAAAAVWRADRWALPFAVVPLLLVQRAFAVPHLQEEASRDAKTQLYNARHFSDAIVEEVGRAARLRRPVSLLMIDLDFLREINNAHGHLAGDAVLTGVAEAIRESVRDGDIAARFGGEEFAVILPGAHHADALDVAARIRAAVDERSFFAETTSESIRATVSVGVACYPDDADNARALVHAADIGLYRAKDEGRNRVVYAGVLAT